MRFVLCLFFLNLFFTAEKSFAQNLLPNPSFEDINICTEHNAPCAPAGWVTPSPFLTGYTGKPGQKYVRLVAFNSSKKNVRQYIQSRILCPLEKGKTYRFSLEIKQDECIIGSLGILFTDQLVYTMSDELIDREPSIDLTASLSNSSERKQKNWLTLDGTYTATGQEKYILIGNFQKEQEQQRKYIKKEKPFASYSYALDNIQLTDPHSDTLCEHAEDIRVHWYNYHIRHSPLQIIPWKAPLPDPLPEEVTAESDPKVDSLRLSDVIFDFNSSQLTNEAQSYLTEVLSAINLSKVDAITVEGHTDNVGSSSYNFNLSMERAEAVKEHLIKMGVDANKVTTKGKGDSTPIADNTTEEGRQQNRRIELFVVYN